MSKKEEKQKKAIPGVPYQNDKKKKPLLEKRGGLEFEDSKDYYSKLATTHKPKPEKSSKSDDD